MKIKIIETEMAKRCPKCGSENFVMGNAFDFKFRIECDDCGHHTAWHINSPQKAVEEWNNQQKENEMAKKVVTTRHPALVELLKERGLIDGTELVLDHATAGDVMGMDVIGVLPLSLACLANTVTEVPLKMTKELREKGELNLEELRAIAGPAKTYKVTEIK